VADDRHDDAERDAGADRDEASTSMRDRPPVATATLVRMEGAGRRTTVLAVAIAVFVAVAIVKPWPSGTAPGFSFRPGTPPPTEAPSADPLAALRLDCQDPPGWRIFSREVWPGGVLRSWRSMIPVAGPTTPLNPAIPVIPISPDIAALGYCAPWAGPERPPDDVAVRIWWVRTGATGSADVRQVEPASASVTLRPPLGALYAAPPSSGLDPFLWPPGTFVFELATPGYERWWGVRIQPGLPDEPGTAVPVPASPVP
jgi:hypothetical protein